MSTPSPVARTAIITGGSGGIGRAVGRRLAADGLQIVVHYAGSKDRADEAVQAVADAGGAAIAVQGDVAEEADVAALFDAAEREFGGVDVVVHAAGIMPLAPLADLDLTDFDRVQRTNVRGTFVVCQQAVRRMREGGAIVTFSSSVTRLALPNYSAYAASKGAVEAMTMILAKELRGRGITVNAVAPGPTATPLFLDDKDQETIDQLAAMPPLERLGQPEDTAELVAFLAGSGHWVNGQLIRVNGGVA